MLIGEGKWIGIYVGVGCEYVYDLLVVLGEWFKVLIVYILCVKDFVEYDNLYNMGMIGIFGIELGYYMLMVCDMLLLFGVDFVWG